MNNETPTFSSLLEHFDSATQKAQAISKEHPQEAQRIYKKIARLQLSLLSHELEHLIGAGPQTSV